MTNHLHQPFRLCVLGPARSARSSGVVRIPFDPLIVFFRCARPDIKTWALPPCVMCSAERNRNRFHREVSRCTRACACTLHITGEFSQQP